jgi:tetratricopeptide (TPR) repeat protein
LCWIGFGLGVSTVAMLGAAEMDTGPAVFARRAEQAFEQARDRFQANTNDVTAAWKLGQAALAWADFAKNNAQREEIARAGMAACRRALTLAPDSAAAHFYLGTNLGQLARARKLEALSLIKEIERQFEAARVLDEQFNQAGPDRCLGLLYLDAPGWPASLGSRHKAREHLERAVALSPGFPENRLSLMEAYVRWKDSRQLRLQAEAYEKGLNETRQRFTGEAWEFDWQDWNTRWNRLLDQLRRLRK